MVHKMLGLRQYVVYHEVDDDEDLEDSDYANLSPVKL